MCESVRRGPYAALLLIVAVSAALRIWSAQDEFWLDEIWSLQAFVRIPHALQDVFTFHHDNNHYLLTIWMDLVGPAQRNWFVYRIPSVLAGIGTVGLSACIARRWGGCAMLSAALLSGTTFVVTVYSSEARGYALAGFFALSAFLALDRYLTANRPWAMAIFVLATILGTLSHLTFLQFYAGAVVWSAVACAKKSQSWGNAARQLGQLHAVPLCALATLYLVDVRAMRIGGGDDYRLLDVLARTLSLAIGSPAETPPWVVVSAVLAAFLGVAGLVQLWREKSDLWIFFTVSFIVAPALLLAISRPTLLYERYFYLNVVFFQVLLSFLLSRVVTISRMATWCAGVALLLIVAGNLKLTADFLGVGRGHYLEALRLVNEQTAGSVVHMAGDDDFDNTVYLGFYVDYLPPGKTFSYTNFAQPRPAGAAAPEWLLLHSQVRPYHPAPEKQGQNSADVYCLEQVFPCGRLSGYQFALYRKN